MGSCFSSSSSSSYSPSTVRLVHLNGHVEDFEHPVTASEVTGKPPSQYLCTAAQLLSSGSTPLKPDAPLRPGQLYFVLPLSALQDDVSHLHMATLVKRLTARAKSHHRSPETRPLATVKCRQERRETTRSWNQALDTISEVI